MVKKSADKFLSIKITRFLMKVVGFWTADTKKERKLLQALQKYTLFAIASAIWVEASDLNASVGDFYSITYAACSAMPVLIVIVKVSTFMYHEKRVLKLLKYTEDNFWYAEYDEYGTKLLDDIDKKAVVIISMFTFFVHCTIFSYMLAPMIANIGRNESDRILPFNIYLGAPVNLSPYFEIAFTVQIVALVHCGLCFCCFDNFLGLVNLHTAAQFRILGHRLEGIFDKKYETHSDVFRDQQIKEEFKQCVLQHHRLLSYVDNVEYIFTYATLCQLLVSSVMLCVAGFQVFLGQGTFFQRLIFISHTNGTFFQIFVTTLTANEMIIESGAIGEAAYNMQWEAFLGETNRYMKAGIIMLMSQSMHPRCITAGGFFPVSLETFMTVLSTAASYFTLLRKFDTDLGGD